MLHLLLCLSIFATRSEDLRVVLDQTYMVAEAEPILRMVADEAGAADGFDAFKRHFHDVAVQEELGTPFDGFSDEEVAELRIIHENPVWQKFAKTSSEIFKQNFASMRGIFQRMTPASIMEITQDNIGGLVESGRPFILEVKASWCEACKSMAGAFNEISNEYGDRIQFGQIDIDSQKPLAKKLGVRNLPAIFFFKAGSKSPMMKTQGALTKEELQAKVNQFIKRTS